MKFWLLLYLEFSINQDLQIVFPNDSLRSDNAINSLLDWTKVILKTENQLIFCHEIEKKAQLVEYTDFRVNLNAQLIFVHFAAAAAAAAIVLVLSNG